MYKRQTYRVRYEDGAGEEIPVVFGEQVGAWNDEQPAPLPGADLGWVGQQPGGGSAAVWVMRWINPHPEKAIRQVDFVREGSPRLGAPALFGITRGERAE